MSSQHYAVTIMPCRDIGQSEAFYRTLGFDTVGDYGHYRIMEDGKGLHLHLNATPGWPARIEDNPVGLYIYVEDVDALAAQMAGQILAPGKPEAKPWGCYEFAVSDPSGALVRIGRIVD